MRSLFRNPAFRALAAGLAISQTGDWLYNVALIVFVLRATGSPGWVAAAGIVRLVPYVIFGTLGGVVADHYPRKRVMIASDVIRAVLMAALAVVAFSSSSALLAIVLAGLSTIFAVAYAPSVGAALPVIVTEDELSAANAIDSTITNACLALGPALGGLLLVLGSPGVAFAFNAGTFLLSAAAVSRIRVDLGPEARDATKDANTSGAKPAGLVARMREGIGAVVSSADVLVLVGAWSAAALLYGLEIVLLALVATRLLGIGDTGLSFLYAAFGVGGVGAAIIAHRAASRSRQGVIIAVTTMIPGLALTGFAFTHVAAVGYVLAAVDGAASIVLDVLVVTSLQRMLGNDVLGRALGAIDSLVVGAILLGSVLAPVLVRLAGVRGALVIGGGIVVVAGLLVLERARGIDGRAAARADSLAPRVEFLAGLDIFDGATRATLEALAADLAEEEVSSGHVVLREGDDPDDLFVILSGRMAVEAASRGRVGELGPRDYFGEIGLLRHIPRTATVRALEPSTLYRIPGEAFLRIIGEGGPSTVLVRNVQARLAATRPAPAEGTAS
jgi:predicted MFS family arabinose efflux permease